ncbi:hypothetical protein EYF80_038525 [Liparis tanakae]|uniref:Uncharacterized protein n=1 Tax=Liparis tanakae TaxID=230148 RepID=A0A4Z2GEX7_9TELE|nr:hypothetical protein EYF80_038525 [Liparis tanakae]
MGGKGGREGGREGGRAEIVLMNGMISVGEQSPFVALSVLFLFSHWDYLTLFISNLNWLFHKLPQHWRRLCGNLYVSS